MFLLGAFINKTMLPAWSERNKLFGRQNRKWLFLKKLRAKWRFLGTNVVTFARF
jgi:hypothetical protein